MKSRIISTIFYCAAVILPLMLCGCGGKTLLRQGYEGQAKQKNAQKPEIKQPEIPHLEYGTCDYEQTKNGVTVRAKVLKTEQECVAAFEENGKRLLSPKKAKHKIYPIKVTVKNNSASKIDLSGVELKVVNYKKVFAKLLGNQGWNVLKTLGLGTGVFIAFPATALAAVIGYFGPITAAGGLAVTGAPALGMVILISAGVVSVAAILGAVVASTAVTLYSVRSHKNRKQKKQNIKPITQALFAINPSETQTFFIFVRQPNYKQNFELTFIDENQTKLPFNLQLPAL